MADNTVLNTGTGGDTIATDDVAGVKYQRVKLVDGTADSSAAIAGDATNGLDVDVTRMPATAADGAAGLPAVTTVIAGYDGTNVQAIVTDSTGRPTVNVNGAVPVTDNAGTLTVDDGGLSLTVDDGAGSLTVDGTVGVSGTVTVDSELTTADLDTGAGTDTRAVVGMVLAASGGGVLVGAANPVPVSDNGGSLTVDGSVTVNAGTGNLGSNLTQLNGTAVDQNSGVKSAGTLRVVLATDQPQLTAALKTDGSAVTQPVSGTVTANLATATSGGSTPSVTISAATTNATSVKASAGQVYTIFASNINAAVRYLKLYNKASAPTVGTDTPVLVFAIPGNTAGAGFALDVGNAFAFSTGIAFALTTGVTNSDTGAVAANELVVNLGYK